MRIVFVVNSYPPSVGGVQAHVSGLARHLARQGHRVTVHTLSSDQLGESIESGVVVHRWPRFSEIGGVLGLPTPKAVLGIWRAVTEEADFVSVHTRFFPITWLGLAAARRAHVPVIHTEHGSDFVASPHWLIRIGSRIVDKTLGKWSLRSADAVLGVSEDVVAFVDRLAGVEAVTFYNAIDPPTAKIPAETRNHLVFVGRIVQGKGWEDFLTVVSVCGDEVTAEVLGDGPDLGELRERAESLGLGGRIEIRGRVSPAAVHEALAGAVLVNPSRLSEGFQTTLLEAVAVGGRVVTYPVPGAQVLAAEGAPVTVVARDVDALTAGTRAALTEPGPGWGPSEVSRWTWPVRGHQFSELLEKIASSRALTKSRPS